VLAVEGNNSTEEDSSSSVCPNDVSDVVCSTKTGVVGMTEEEGMSDGGLVDICDDGMILLLGVALLGNKESSVDGGAEGGTEGLLLGDNDGTLLGV
jgi:hypothetical protein